MSRYRKYLIVALNTPFILLIVKAMCIDTMSDTNGYFSICVLILMFFFNLYAKILHGVFRNEEKVIYNEIAFVVFLLLPFVGMGLWFYSLTKHLDTFIML